MDYKLSRKGDDIYVTTEDGKVYKLQHCLNHHAAIRRVDEIRENETLRRVWYRRHVVSRDLPNSCAARADFSDGGKWERRLTAWIDGGFDRPKAPKCVIAKNNCRRIASKLGLVHWHGVGRFVAAVWQNGLEGRKKTMEAFGLAERTYRWRCELYAKMLGWGR